jgi:hypothetical protein
VSFSSVVHCRTGIKRAFEVLTKIFGLDIDEKDGDNHMERNVIICTRHVLLLGKLNEEG